jgi:alpha-ketoglutarate-dependent taurine dioxygenase
MPIKTIHYTESSSLASMPAAGILAQLRRSGVLLFRGFTLGTGDFEAFTNRLCRQFHYPAARASMRTSDSDGFSTHVPDINFVLLSHSEGAYTPHPYPPYTAPDIACFFCIVPPSEPGGQTTLVDGVEFLRRIPQAWMKRFKAQGVIYEAYWQEERWRHEFRVEDKKAALDLLKQVENIDYRFHGSDLHFRHKTAAITTTSTGQKAFATGILAHLPAFNHPRYSGQLVYTNPTNKVYFGNGEALDDELINALVDIQDEIAIAHDWQANDLVLIDNTRFMHGRTMTEKDCERVILSRFGHLEGSNLP